MDKSLNKQNKILILCTVIFALFIFAYNDLLDAIEGARLQGSEWRYTLIVSLLGNILLLYILIRVDLKIISKLKKWRPWGKRNIERVFAEIFITLIWSLFLVSIALLLSYFIGSFFNIKYSFTDIKIFFLENAFFVADLNFIVIAIVEGSQFFQEWKKSLLREKELDLKTQTLERENMELKYESLKAQLNPHFLFNNLSILSSLCYPESKPEKAKHFIDEFSSIYRYILDSGEDLLSTIRSEIQFIESYLYLLQVRFGEGIKFNLNVPEQFMDRCLPTLSLQLLLENAVKHNKTSLNTPLNILIYIDDNHLVVENTVNRKEDIAHSTGYGTKRLEHFYKYISNENPKIIENKDRYIVKLPLLTD